MVRKPIIKNISIYEDECKQTLTIFLDYVLSKQTFFLSFLTRSSVLLTIVKSHSLGNKSAIVLLFSFQAWKSLCHSPQKSDLFHACICGC